ncbi:PLP-dependent aminotransferase family protein [Mucilaginibacter sp. L3T2-6]|uniref:aminotransferase-like domain-containing protein n=1 Tax=Mucilaginibacter sp. L3T2-6 TaxID=3062491 RepID=UPI0026771412|nr:PLP-dependent aminotransferase family protein [Mucilaginibacter sp. L3T2-6]MDO3643739.1 PLP-dependent aminotransferase family protein [Mucilaginibacter sp. L3T2-6]MDV6216190.1 PLP-dependent aminotransferase family protein [Mucilaginibacter sp. L3T2-6]
MTIQTIPFSNLISIDRTSAIPLFRQLANALLTLIRNGKIKPGHRLPSSREMAAMIKLNRTTVIAAYDELRSQGWLEVFGKKGIFISSQLPVINPKSFKPEKRFTPKGLSQSDFYRQINFDRPPYREIKPFHLLINDGYPDSRITPIDSLFNRYKALLSKADLHSPLMTGNVAGSLSLRRELADFLSKTRALNIETDNVLVSHGAQLAIYIAASMVLKAGSTVIVADMNYILADKLFEQLGARLVKVKVDENGIDVDAIEEICSRCLPDLLYIIPHHHHPTTVTLSAERRMKLVDIIRRYQLPVIEDDYDYDFHYNNSPILPLASADHNGYVLYVGSISKTLAPTIRLGYLVGDADFIRQASRLKQLMEIRGDVLFEESVAYLFTTGEFQRHLRRSVKLYRQRRDRFCELLKTSLGDLIQFTIPQGGMAVWIVFPQDYSISELSKRLYAKGVYLNDGSLYRYSDTINGIRVGFASLNDAEMEKFATALAQVK